MKIFKVYISVQIRDMFDSGGYVFGTYTSRQTAEHVKECILQDIDKVLAINENDLNEASYPIYDEAGYVTGVYIIEEETDLPYKSPFEVKNHE